MLPVSEPQSPNLIRMPELIPLQFGYEMSLEEVLPLREALIIEEDGSLDLVTSIALERLRILGFSSIAFSSQEIRIWFLAYEFAFVKMTSILQTEMCDSDKKNSMLLVSRNIHLIATRYFSCMQEKFVGKDGLDSLFEFRRKKAGFEAWVLEDKATCDVCDLISQVMVEEEAFKVSREKGRKPHRFTFA